MSTEETKTPPAPDGIETKSPEGVGGNEAGEIISFEAKTDHDHTAESKDLKTPKELQENIALTKIITALGAALAETDPAVMKTKIQAVLNSLKSMGGKKAEAVEDSEAVKKIKAEAEAKERELGDRIAKLEEAKDKALVENTTKELLKDGSIAPIQAEQVKKIFSMNPALIPEFAEVFKHQKLTIPIGKETAVQTSAKEGKEEFSKEDLARIEREHGITQLKKERGI